MHSDMTSPEVARRLRDLPGELQPPYEWHEFQRRMRERSQRSAYRVGRSGLAAAAFVTALVAGIALWGRLLPPPDVHEEVTVHVDAREVASAARAERWLAGLPPEPAVFRVDTRVAVTDLEDRIAWVDELLTSERLEGAQPRIAALQQERAMLVTSLATVRYVETLETE